MGTQALDVGVAATPLEETFYYRVWVRDATPNWSEYRDASVYVDTLPPTGTFVLAAGAQYTTSASVTADSSVIGASEMRFDAGGGYGSWVPYAATHPLTLVGGDGTRSVTAQYRDAAGNVTSLTDSIVLDTVAPPAPTGLSVIGSGRDWIEISWSAAAAADVSAYIVSRRPESSATWSEVGTVAHPATAFRDEDLPADAGYRYRVSARDHAGNVGPASTEVPAAVGVPVERLAGIDRYSTAIAISKATFLSADEIVLATGESYADALGASALAGALDAPVLLTRSDRLSTGVLGEIARLGGTRVVIIGGTSAVGAAVERSLQSAGLFTRRIAGVDRYATAAGVAAETLKSRGPVAMPGHVFVVSGEDFADALAVSSAAYAGRIPVLLVRRNGVPQATLQAISSGGYTRAVVVGGTAVVPDSVRSRLGVASDRVYGADRYATAAAFARWASAASIVDFETIGLATGRSFPDALGGGAALGAQNGVLLLTDPNALSAAARTAIADHADIAASLRVLGGESAVSSAVLSQALIALR
ncbi:MAG: cell wall-binding repeat-containing protein, partial [Coriobacteriia bacterium]|nr:cell wall-binding repeat-containing protein [Coriobacteriia bacterium]